MSNIQTLKGIERLEGQMLEANMDILDCPLKHQFSDGVYVREITMPTGSIILGHEHTTSHFNVISKGGCILIDLDTQELTEIIAPCTFESKAGVRKLLYIVSDCVWSTIHVTDETDLEKIEEQVIVKSDTYNKLKGDTQCLGLQ